MDEPPVPPLEPSMDGWRAGHENTRAHLHWRHTEDPLIVEAAEVAAGWRHLTIARPADRARCPSPSLSRLFAEFHRYRGRPHALCGGTDGARSLLVVAIGPPDAESEIRRIYRLADRVNPGDWEITFLGRPLPCPLPD